MNIDSIKLLIVDDDEDDFYLTSDYLKDIPNKKFEITWASSFNEGIAQLAKTKFDLCFFDFLLGIKTGIDLLKIAVEKGINCPIVLFTGKGDQKVDIEAMRLGAMDYLVKSDLDAEKLDRCIRYALERAETMRRLRESEKRLQHIFEQMKEAIVLKSTDGLIFYHNKTALDLFNFDEKAIADRHFSDFFAIPDNYYRFKEILENQESIDNYEASLVRKNGERVLCSLNSSKQKDSDGNDYYLIVINDITARKKMERDRLLAEKSASTARLARTLAHEVRNPLTNIHLSLDQLDPELEDEELKLFTNIIRRNSHRINTLITELLDSFKPQETILTEVSIVDLLEKALNEASDRLSLKKITLQKYFSEDCHLLLDQSKIKIAFLNLIINAIEAMEAEKGILNISTHTDTNFCYVKIQDNGIGISADNLNKLFEPYFTLKTNGLGLGLAATLTILQSHNARVEVESELGKGTIFMIIFSLKN
ncbi:Adaptive-response sensory-kinase SasA [Emticicia aquatica]|jgi:PAS domain S-box-containing protein|uniref:histidine kinase n=1 Tax=Emticicia aquatica TaxID=1681835 RepID=A0ABM9AQR4_9BACT|nr:hybrid sensor histidine kinase/response regulator [Emticicia aquatica]CAH0996047.1 Adaptive-response sensory-kinase SasA [Emticicia aquatica]